MNYSDYQKWKSGSYRKDEEEDNVSEARKESDALRSKDGYSYSNYEAWKDGSYDPNKVAADQLEKKEAEDRYKALQEKSGLDQEKDKESLWGRAKGFASRLVQGTVTKGRKEKREDKATLREQELIQFLTEAEKAKQELDPSRRKSILARMPDEYQGEDSEWVNFYLTWEVIKKDAQEQLAIIQQNKQIMGEDGSEEFRSYGASDIKEIVSEGGLRTQFVDGTATNASEAMDLIRTHNENLRKYREENIEGYDTAKYDTEYWQKQERKWNDLLENADQITTGKPIQKGLLSGLINSMDEVREQAFINSLSKYVGESAAKKLKSGEITYEDLRPSERVEIGQMLLDQARGQIDTTTELELGEEKIPIDWYSIGKGIGNSAVYMQEIFYGSLLTGGVMSALGAGKLLAPVSKNGGKALYYAKRIGQSLVKGAGIEASTGFIKDFASTADDMNGEYMFVFDEEDGVSIDTIMQGEDNPYKAFAENVATQSVMNALEIIGVDTLGTAKGATSAVVKKAIGEEAFEELTKTIGKSALYTYAKKFGASTTGEVLNGIRKLAGLDEWSTEIEEELWQGWWEGLTDNEDWIPTGKEFAEIVGVTGVMQLTFNALGLGGKVIGKNDQDKMNKVLTEMVEQGAVTDDTEVEIPDSELSPIGDDTIPIEPEEQLTQAEINKRIIQQDLEALGEVEQEVDKPLTEVIAQQNRQEAYDAIGDKELADKIIDGKIESATQLMAEAEKAGVTEQLAESLGVYDLIENPDQYIEKIGMNPEQLTESAAVNEAFRVLASEMMSNVVQQAKTKEATKQEQLQGDISLDQLSSSELTRLGGIVNSIQATFDTPPSRTMTQVESGEWIISKDGVPYPSFVSERLRNKKVLSVALDAINNSTVPKRGTRAYDAYQEILNQAVGVEDDRRQFHIDRMTASVAKWKEQGLDKDMPNEFAKLEAKLQAMKDGKPYSEVENNGELERLIQEAGRGIRNTQTTFTGENLKEVDEKKAKKGDSTANKKAKPSEAVEQTKKEKRSSDPTTTRDSAKDLIRKYVERGDSLESLKKGQLGHSSPDGYSASIGGYVKEKRIPADKIIVSRMGGKDIEPEIFDLEELYNEIKQEPPADASAQKKPSKSKPKKVSEKKKDMLHRASEAYRIALKNKNLGEGISDKVWTEQREEEIEDPERFGTVEELENNKGIRIGDMIRTSEGEIAPVASIYEEGGEILVDFISSINYGGNENINDVEKVSGGSGTQKDVIKKAIAETPKSIKQIAEETKILEPNIRRILGVGTKEGEFERVASGVYILKKDGQQVAYIIPGDALEELPRLAEEGFKADMIFLDIPYKTPAVTGGNRGMKYEFITPEEFGDLLDSVKAITRSVDTPIIYMFSQAQSGMKEMAKYTSQFDQKGLIAMARGQWQKRFKSGKKVTNVRGKISEPEGILIFSQSGILPNKSIPLDLRFDLVRPRGYQSEKNAEMIEQMIKMTTSEGDVVLDPFAGSGVVPAEAVKAGRVAVAIEKNKDVVENVIIPRVSREVEETDQEAIERIVGEIFSSENTFGDRKDPLYEYNTFTNTYTDDFKGRSEVLEAIDEVTDFGGIEYIERVEVSIDRLTPTEMFNYNNEGVQRAIKEISSGIITPLVVNSDLEIWDGNHRFVAYKTLGIKKVPVLKPKDIQPSMILNDVEPSPYRGSYPKVRGGWTVAKIDRALNNNGSSSGEKAWTTEWNKFDDDAQLEQNLFYHGTHNYIEGGIKPSSALKKMSEEELGGGYGERYHSISLTKSRNTAKNFSGATSRTVNIYPVLLKKGAIIEDLSNEIDDSIDLEDRLEELWNKGVDAVWIGGGEQELAVLNPKAIVLGNHIKESFPVYGLSKLENKALEQLAGETAEVVKSRLEQLETSIGMLMKKPDDLHDFDPRGLKQGISNLIKAERIRERHKLPAKKHTACVEVFLELARKEPLIPFPVRAVWATDVDHAIKVLARSKPPVGSVLGGFQHIDTAENIREINNGNPKSVYIGDPRFKKYMKEGYKLFTEEQIVGGKYLNDSAVGAKTRARQELLKRAALESADKIMAQKYASFESPNNKLFARVITQDVGVKRVGKYNIEGKTINNNQDIVLGLDAYRGHHYEIFHLVFVDDTNTVVSHRAYSDIERDQVSLPINNFPRMDRLAEEVKEAGATRFYMVHNHPSQNVSPSAADYYATITTINEFKRRGIEYADHIILDTKRVSYMGKPSTTMGVFDDFDISSRYSVRELEVPLVYNAKRRSSLFQEPKYRVNSIESFGSLVKQIHEKKIPLNGFNVFPVNNRLGYKSIKNVIPLSPATAVRDGKLRNATETYDMAVRNYNDQIGAIYDNLKSFRGFVIISEKDLTTFEKGLLMHKTNHPFYATDIAFIEQDGTVRVLSENSWKILPDKYNASLSTMNYAGERGRYFDDENMGNRLFDVEPSDYDTTPDSLKNIEKNVQLIALPELLQMAQGLLENDIELKSLRKKRGFFQRIGSQGRIVLKREMFSPEEVMILEGGKIKKGFAPETPAEIRQRLKDISTVLAHEMGHLIDWLDTKEMARGNILGRIASLRGYMGRTYGNLDNKEIREELIKHSDNWRLDKGAISQLQEAKKKAKEVVQLAKDKKDDAAQARAEKYLKQINKELSYYTSSKELYADALSALLVDPDTLKRNAPKFYHGFMDYVHRKPKVRQALFDAYDMILEGQEAINRARLDNLVKAIAEGKRKREEIDVKTIDTPARSFKKAFDKIINLTVSQYNPIYSTIDASMAEKGVKISKKAEVRLKLENLAMINNDLGLYVEKVKSIFAEMVKAGISEDQASVLAILERTLGDRKDIANPNAMMYQYSEETLEELKAQLTPEQYDVLMEQMKRFRELNFELVQKGAEAGLYSGDFMRDVAEKNKDTYMPFGVLDYIENNYVTSQVIEMVGTLKEVESPIATQILKSIAIIQATAENIAKREVVSTLMEVDPENVKPAGVRRGNDGRFIAFKKTSDPKKLSVLPLMVDGKYTGFEVDKQIAAMFTENPWRTEFGQSAMQLAKIAGFFSFYFKPLVTSYNLSWALYANPIRDFQRSSKGLFAVLSAEGKLSAIDKLSVGVSLDLRLLKSMFISLKPAFKYARGQTTDITSEMIQKRVIDYQADPITTEDLDKYEGFALLAPALRKVGQLKPEVEYKASKANRVRESMKDNKAIKALWYIPDIVLRGVSGLGRIFEVWSKISGYRILKESGVGETTLINSTRNYLGTPNFKEKGVATPFTNEVWVFSNVALQAHRTQLELMRNPQTRGAFWFKLLATAIVPKFIQLLVEYGWLGDDDDELAMKGATFYDKAKYLVFPMGMVTDPDTGDREGLYMRIPQDEGTRTFATIAYQIMKMAMDEDEQWNAKNFGKTAKFTMDDLNPFSTSIGLDLVSMWSSYLQDRNPYDDYRGRNAINQQLWDAGGQTRFMEMVKLTGNTVGLTSFKTYDEPNDTTIEYVLDLPVLERMFRMTSYGLTEEWYAQQDQKVVERAREKIEEKAILTDLVDNYLNNNDLEMSEAIALYQISVMGEEPEDGWKGTDKAKYTRLRKDFKEAVFEYHEPNAYNELTVYGMRNTDKVEVYASIKERRNQTDWVKFATMARDLEVMSDDMLELLVDTGVIDQSLANKLENL